MAKSIALHSVIPVIFANQAISSEIWNQDVVFEKGKSYLIEASSGKGKSTMLSYIYAYRNDYSGTICIDDTDINSLSENDIVVLRQRVFAYLFQELRLFPTLTALENIEVKNQLTRHKSRQQIERLLERLGIADKADTPVRLLSWGQQQRVAFVRTLCQPCDFVLLDEPISHIDNQNAQTMVDILTEEQSNYGFGIITTSIGHHLPLNYNRTLQL
ncbi:MAG: ATP-binding cassette domain-containing protein [Paludibacteraceae bacterium]|nr:ATP-binding cassette domain-containing protein [Paludibacteraceae bacterium]